MALNIERIKNQVQKAIKVAPFSVTLKRQIYENDNWGGKVPLEVVDAFSGICLFDNSGDGAFSLTQSDAGREEQQAGPYLIVVYEKPNQILEEDYFEYGGSRFTVTKVTNILGLNIYLQVRLEETKL